jgi:hypothetical protein
MSDEWKIVWHLIFVLQYYYTSDSLNLVLWETVNNTARITSMWYTLYITCKLIHSSTYNPPPPPFHNNLTKP